MGNVKIGGSEVELDSPPPGMDLQDLDDMPDDLPVVPEINGDDSPRTNSQNGPPAFDDPADTVEIEADHEDEPEGRETPEGRQKGKGYDRRISELTGEKHALREDRDHWRDLALKNAKISETAGSVTAETAPKPEDPPQKPTLDGSGGDFEVYTEKLADYTDQKAAYEARQAVRQIREEEARQQQTAQQQAKEQEAYAIWQQSVERGRKQLDNFDAIAMNETLSVSPTMFEALRDSDVGPEILYHLGLNPEKASKIADLPLTKQGVAIGRIEQQIMRKRGGSAPDDHRRVSNAPPPPSTVGNSKSTTRDPNKMSQDEYRQYRQSGGGARLD